MLQETSKAAGFGYVYAERHCAKSVLSILIRSICATDGQ